MTWIQTDENDELFISVTLWPEEKKQLLALAQRDGVSLDAVIMRAVSAACANPERESAFWQSQVAEFGMNGWFGCAIEALLEEQGAQQEAS